MVKFKKARFMNRKLISISSLVLLFVSVSLTGRVQQAKASDTIYIRADGSVEGTDKIVSADNVTYTFTDSINDSIYVQRNNIILDGDGFSLVGSGSSGVYSLDRVNVTIRNINMVGFNYGIFLNNSTHCNIIRNNLENITSAAVYIYLNSNFNNISENSMASDGNGIYIRESSNCTMFNNNITCERADNKFGIYLYYSSNNTMSSNNVTQSQACIYIYYSNDNSLYGNNLTNSGYSQDGGGVWVERSHFNNIDGNFISESRWHGIELYRSSNNSILGNEITSNNNRGIMVQTVSNYNTISGNNVNDNYKGIEITSSSFNNIIRNNNITANQYEGIVIDYSWNNTISGNNLVDDNTGILIGGSSDHNNVTGNSLTGCGRAISLIEVAYCSLYGNNLTDNYFGLTIQSSTKNTVEETMMLNNTCSFSLLGYNISHFTNYVDQSNTVDHKPIYYWIDAHNSAVPDDAGCVILVECTNITAQNMNLSSHNWQGVALAYSKNITIADNYLTHQDQYGIWLVNSSECFIARNYLNGFIGLQLNYASNNTFFGNTLTSGGNWGSVNLVQSYNNTFYHNNFTDNYIDYLIDDFSVNNWDNGYPAGGNYWDNYEDRYPSAKDENSGPYQNQTGSDNIWDTPYTLNDNNIDHYPIIPEFPSLILPLFMLAVSFLTLICKKKRNV